MGSIRDDDAVIFFNFRADRARQMTYALAEPDFDKFADAEAAEESVLCGHDAVRQELALAEVRDRVRKSWSTSWRKCLQDLQYKNLRCAETEKYAHVTYFFNGGVEKPFAGEERILVPSPKVATYDLKPEMSAAGNHGHGGESHREGRIRRHHHELRERGHGGPFRQTRSQRSRPSKPWTPGWGAFIRR